MKKIVLTQGKIALVDDADYDWLNQWKWIASKPARSRTYYVYHSVLIARAKRYTTEWMHRLILGLQMGDKQQCDHIDHNGLNNQRSNLRVCTKTQNMQSSRKRKRRTSKYKGVCWHRHNRKWYSRICVKKKEIHLGFFDSEIDAAAAYNVAALKHFGDFALLNTL